MTVVVCMIVRVTGETEEESDQGQGREVVGGVALAGIMETTDVIEAVEAHARERPPYLPLLPRLVEATRGEKITLLEAQSERVPGLEKE